MSSEDAGRLDEASKHFQKQSFDQCIRMLNLCSQEDPKRHHNLVIANYIRNGGGSYREFVQNLNLPEPLSYTAVNAHAKASLPSGKHSSQPITVKQQHFALQYEGQELAYLNKAVMLLHNRCTEEARQVLMVLAAQADSFSNKTQARIAMLLQLIVRRQKKRTAETEDEAEIIAKLGGGKTDNKDIKDDKELTKMMQLAYADTEGLHQWFTSTKKESGEHIAYLNNLACEAFADGKPHLAGIYLNKAISVCESIQCPFTKNTVLFNNGLCALARGEAVSATQSFLMSTKTINSPILWVRVAQAFLQQHSDLEAKAAYVSLAAQQKQRADAAIEGKFPVFAPIPLPSTKELPGSQALLIATTQALHNGLVLIYDGHSEDSEATMMRVFRTGGNHAAELYLVLLSYLCYVELCKGNAPLAVAYCEDFFTALEAECLKKPPPYVAKAKAIVLCYYVEALCSCNRAPAALKTLQDLDLGSLVADAVPNSSIEALLVNLCVVHIANGNWAKAFSVATSVLGKLSIPHATLVQVYLELAQGNREGALDIVEKKPIAPLLHS